MSNTTLIAPQPKGILDPSTGQPIGANDAYFGEINNELALVRISQALLNRLSLRCSSGSALPGGKKPSAETALTPMSVGDVCHLIRVAQ